MDKRKDDFDTHMALAAFTRGENQSNTLGEQLHRRALKYAEKFKPVEAAKLVSTLFYAPEFQSNILQVEALVHLTLASGKGTSKLRSRDIAKLFKELKKTSFEYDLDPAEDVMTSQVFFEGKSYSILEGIYEGNTFYLQRMLNAFESIKNVSEAEEARRSITSLLNFSDVVFSESNLEVHTVGQRLPRRVITRNHVKNATNYGRSFSKTKNELADFSIDSESLAPFIFDLTVRGTLIDSILGASEFEKSPIIESEDELTILLPSSIGVAIRTFIISFCEKNALLERFNSVFQSEYVRHFSQERNLLGNQSETQFYPVKDDSGRILAAETRLVVDPGRYIQILFQFDDFEGFEHNYVNSYSPNSERIGTIISGSIAEAASHLQSEESFHSGISLVVLSGWGRPSLGVFEDLDCKPWRREYISAHDFESLCNLPGMSSSKFWRFIEAIALTEELGIFIPNINGLLNLYGYFKGNNYMALEEGDFFDGMKATNLSDLNVMIGTNYILDVRLEAIHASSKKLVVDPSGNAIFIAPQLRNPLFKTEEKSLSYASVTDIQDGRLVGVILGRKTLWWSYPQLSGREKRDFVFKIWEATCQWLERLERVISDLGGVTLPSSVVWEWQVEEFDYPSQVNHVPSFEELRQLVSSSVTLKDNSVHVQTKIETGFANGFHKEDNDAEFALVSSFVESIFSSDAKLNNDVGISSTVLSRLFTSKDIKHIHLFQAHNFRDFVSASLPKPIFVDEIDSANLKVGLGWLNKSPKSGGEIFGSSECTKYLNDLVDELLSKIKRELSQFDRTDAITKLLLNHESIQSSAKRWRRTYRAVLATHKNSPSTNNVVFKEIGLRNAGSISTRLVIEMAICECKSNNGRKIGHLDISRLCAYTALVFHLGNSSDAIHFGLLAPHIKISPLGDVLFEQDFNDNVIAPYGKRVQSKLLNYDASKYGENFISPEGVGDVSGSIDSNFITAWKDEFGIDIDDYRRLIDEFENDGIESGNAVINYSKSELLKIFRKLELDQSSVDGFLSHFVLNERASWDDLPDGLSMFHIMPWRFKRNLSLYRRPVLKFDDQYFVTPGLLREGFAHHLQNCYEGSIPPERFETSIMRRWIGDKRKNQGYEFNMRVAQRFSQLECKVLSEAKLEDLLNLKLDRDYGDVDVVAWNKTENVIFLVECKSLEFAKTEGEIAQQVSEFRGRNNHKGKPDRLLKHLQRINVIDQHKEKLIKRLNLLKGVEIIPCLMFSEVVPINLASTEVETRFQLEIVEFSDIETFVTNRFRSI